MEPSCHQAGRLFRLTAVTSGEAAGHHGGMAYIVPTAADLKARYPAFAAVSDATIDVWLEDAQRTVKPTWLEDDYRPGIMSLAAHNMAEQSVITGGQSLAGVTSFKSSQFSITLSDQAASATGYAATIYGREFRILLARNVGGMRLVACV